MGWSEISGRLVTPRGIHNRDACLFLHTSKAVASHVLLFGCRFCELILPMAAHKRCTCLASTHKWAPYSKYSICHFVSLHVDANCWTPSSALFCYRSPPRRFACAKQDLLAWFLHISDCSHELLSSSLGDVHAVMLCFSMLGSSFGTSHSGTCNFAIICFVWCNVVVIALHGSNLPCLVHIA